MRKHIFAVALFLSAASVHGAQINFGPSFGGHTYGAQWENGKYINYWQKLEKRRNIPKTFEEYVEKRDIATDAVHKMELIEPGKNDTYWTLKDVLDYGWADCWSKKNPGLYDVLWISGSTVGMLALIVIVGQSEERNARRRGARG